MQARTAMTRDVICISPDDTLEDAHLIMIQWRIRHLPVVATAGSRALVGILSDRDVLRHGALHGGLLMVPRIKVAQAMTTAPLTCAMTSTVAHVAGLMLDHRIDAVPVVTADGELQGLITGSDLLELLRDRDEKEGKILPFTYNVRIETRAVA